METELRNVAFRLLKMVVEYIGYGFSVVVLRMNAEDPSDVAHVGLRPMVHEQGALVCLQVWRQQSAQGVQGQWAEDVVAYDDGL